MGFVGIDLLDEADDLLLQVDAFEGYGMREDGREETLAARQIAAIVHHDTCHVDGHSHFASAHTSGALLGEFDSLHIELHRAMIVAGLRHHLRPLAHRLYQLVGGGSHSGIHLLIEHAGVDLLLGEQVERLLARTKNAGRELHRQYMIFVKSVGIYLEQRVKHLENHLNLLLTLLIVLEHIVGLGDVEHQPHQQCAKLAVAVIGPLA